MYDEEGGFVCLIGKGGWQTKGNGKGKGKFDGTCYNCGKPGHSKGEQKGKGGDTGKGEHNKGGYMCGGKGQGYGKGKGINMFEGQVFAPQPQPLGASSNNGNFFNDDELEWLRRQLRRFELVLFEPDAELRRQASIRSTSTRGERGQGRGRRASRGHPTCKEK